jgi:hypothetical protein
MFYNSQKSELFFESKCKTTSLYKKTSAFGRYARKILVIIFNVLKTGQAFDPKRNLQATVPD